MKIMKKIGAIGLVLGILCSLTACGSNSDVYSSYSSAYKKTASVGSLHAQFGLAVEKDGQTIESKGNMKMNAKNEVYYEMEINGKQIMQYVKNGEVHTFVDGNEQISSTSDKENGVQRADPDGGEGQSNEKADGTGFNTDKFLEEFSGVLEAGKIKELGILDPIDSKYIKEITMTEEGSEKVYTMTFPNEFLNILLDVLVDEQVNSYGTAIKFSDLKDFQCISKENSSGYLYFIEYKGYTTVTVPADLTADGKETSFDLYIDLQAELQNPGTAVDVVIPD